MFERIHHVAIICSNYLESKRFYTEILELKILAENYRTERESYKLDLALPDSSQVELFSFPNPPAIGIYTSLEFSINKTQRCYSWLKNNQIRLFIDVKSQRNTPFPSGRPTKNLC